MNFSNGWLYKFKKCNSFKTYRLFGEFGDANIEGTISELLTLRKEISEYYIINVFNADEFGLLCNQFLIIALDIGGWLEGKRKRASFFIGVLCQ